MKVKVTRVGAVLLMCAAVLLSGCARDSELARMILSEDEEYSASSELIDTADEQADPSDIPADPASEEQQADTDPGEIEIILPPPPTGEPSMDDAGHETTGEIPDREPVNVPDAPHEPEHQGQHETGHEDRSAADMEPGSYDPDNMRLLASDRSRPAYRLAYDVEAVDPGEREVGMVGVPDGYRAFRITLKKGILAKDGTELGADAVIASFKRELDAGRITDCPDIMGLGQYLTGIPDGAVERIDAIIEAGIRADASFPRISGITPSEQNEVWSLIDEAGERFAANIIRYVNSSNRYANDAYVSAFFSNGMKYSEIAQDESLKTALAFTAWGFGREKFDYDVGNRTYTDCYLKTYDLDAEGMGPKDLWNVIFKYYGYDLSDDRGINYEKSPDSQYRLQDYLRDVAIEHATAGTDVISGVFPGRVRYTDGRERECVYVIVSEDTDISGFDFDVTE